MDTCDAVVILSGGIRQDPSGKWMSTDFSVEDDRNGAPGAIYRVRAGAVLARKHPHARIIATGGLGYDVPPGTPSERPFLAEILQNELIEAGVAPARIMLETKSQTTHQQLRELGVLARAHGWKSVCIVTSRWHIPRTKALLEMKVPELIPLVTFSSAEEILIGEARDPWEDLFLRVYAEPYMQERIAREKKGIADLRAGVYVFK